MAKQARWMALAVWILAALLVGCQTGTQQPEAQGPGKTGAKEAEKPAEQVATVTVPAGTALAIRLAEGIDTGTATEGASFEGTLASALVAGGTGVAPLGSRVTGKVTRVVSSGRLNRPAELSLVLTSLVVAGGDNAEISTQPWSMKGESHKKRNIEMIGGGAGAGVLIGALAGGKKGAAIGGAVGAGAGTGAAAATGKKEIQLAPETKLTFKLSAPLTATVRKKASAG